MNERHPAELIRLGFWIAIGFHVGTIAFVIAIVVGLFILGWWGNGTETWDSLLR